MTAHTFPVDNADKLESTDRFRYCSAEELRDYVTIGVKEEDRVVDIGSGSGFFTREVAPAVDELIAIDLQPEMHRYHQEAGCHDRTILVAGTAEDLPIATRSVQTVFSTMTFHEYAQPTAFDEIKRILKPGGRHVVVDWSPSGPGTSGPPLAERVSLTEATRVHRNRGFVIETARNRQHTFLLSARNKTA